MASRHNTRECGHVYACRHLNYMSGRRSKICMYSHPSTGQDVGRRSACTHTQAQVRTLVEDLHVLTPKHRSGRWSRSACTHTQAQVRTLVEDLHVLTPKHRSGRWSRSACTHTQAQVRMLVEDLHVLTPKHRSGRWSRSACPQPRV